MDAQRQPFGQRGLAHAGLADQQRVVLAPAAEHLNHALELERPADQRIDLPSGARLRSDRWHRPRADRLLGADLAAAGAGTAGLPPVGPCEITRSSVSRSTPCLRRK